MRKILTILSVLFSLTASAQLAVHDTSFYGAPVRGMMTFSPTANRVYYRDNTHWVEVAPPINYSAGFGLSLTSYVFGVDSDIIATRHYLDSIIATLGAPDSSIYATHSFVDSGYLRKADTSTLSTRIDARVKYTDTSTMLTPYLRKIDTASLSTRIDARVKYTDTATMLSPYVQKVTTVNGNALSSNVTTSLASQSDANITSPSNHAFLEYLTADSKWHASTPTWGTGTVTSVGLSSSDITVTGSTPITTSGSWTLSLPTVNSNVGTFGDATHAGQFTANAKGQVTAASSVSIQIAESQVTSLVSDLAGKQATMTGGTGWNVSAGVGYANTVVYKATGVNIKTTGNTTVFTTESGRGRFHIQLITVSCTAISGSGTTASCSMGQTASTYTDLCTNQALSGLTTLYNDAPMGKVNPIQSIPASTAVIFKVNTGSTYTTHTADVFVWGWYENY